MIAEVFMVVEGVRYAKANLASWMKADKRKVALTFQPAKAKVHYQPKGVIGVISPWNYPVNLALGPMAGARKEAQKKLYPILSSRNTTYDIIARS